MRQEAQAAPHQRRGDEGGGGEHVGRVELVADQVCPGEERPGGDEDHPGGQPVEPVEEVHRVGRDHHDQDGERHQHRSW